MRWNRVALAALAALLACCFAACPGPAPGSWESAELKLAVNPPEGWIVRPDRFDEQILVSVYRDEVYDDMYNPSVELKDLGPAGSLDRAIQAERDELDSFPKTDVKRDMNGEINGIRGWLFEADYRSVSKDIHAEIFLFEREGRMLRWAYLRSPFEDNELIGQLDGIFKGLKPLEVEAGS